MRVFSQSSPKWVDSGNRLVPKRYIVHSGYSVCFLAQMDIKNTTGDQQGNTHPGQDEAVAEITFTYFLRIL